MKAADIERLHGGHGVICYVSGKTVKQIAKAACGQVRENDSEGHPIIDAEFYAVTQDKILKVE
jgi:hypothetical protein